MWRERSGRPGLFSGPGVVGLAGTGSEPVLGGTGCWADLVVGWGWGVAAHMLLRLRLQVWCSFWR